MSPARPILRLIAVITVLAHLALQFGCAASSAALRPAIPLHARLRTQKVALVSLPTEIDVSPEFFARGRLAGTLKGAALGPVKFLSAGGTGGGGGGAALVILAALAVTLGTTIGAIEGAIKATPSDRADRLDREIHRAFERVAVHLDLARQVQAVSRKIKNLQLEEVTLVEPRVTVPPDYRALRNSGYGALLEVAVTELRFQVTEKQGSRLSLYVAATARVIDPSTNSVLYEREFSQTTPPAEWSGVQGGAVLRLLDESMRAVAQAIVTNVFESVSLPLSSHYWAFPGTSSYGWCWLSPLDPPSDYRFLGGGLHPATVHSLQPVLSWRPFPDEAQHEVLRRELGREVDGVTYDIKIWQQLSNSLPRLVYERYALSRPAHVLEQPLEPDIEYYWSMRACFPYDRVAICTPWAFSSLPSAGSETCDMTAIPLRNYFRFKTPPSTGF